MRRIDTAWFYSQARTHLGSIRKLAAVIHGRAGPIDPSALVRRLRGQHELTLSEIEQLAYWLRTPVIEVIRRCGVDLDAHTRKQPPRS